MKRNPYLLVFLTALLCSGCVREFRSPKVEIPAQYTFAESCDTCRAVVNEEWWSIFGDTTLSNLIDEAILGNQDVAMAASRIEQARLSMDVARSQFLPSVEVSASASGNYTRETKISQEYALKPGVAWEISLFGALRNTTRAARAEILASEAAYRSVMLSLAAEVADTYFSLMQYRRSLEISERSFVLRQQSMAMIDSMFRHGMSSAVDLEQAQGLTAQAAADIPQYRMAVDQTIVSLSLLLGCTPEKLLARRELLDSISFNHMNDSLPLYVPAGLPSTLLERRPDVLEAWYAMESSAAKIGIAKAARFPNLNLTADGGVLANSIKGLTASNPFVWSAALQLTQPIFAFGRNKRNVEIAREEHQQSVLAYEKAVITALGDVENALVAIRSYRRQAERYRALIRSNSQIRLMTTSLYEAGLSDYLNVLDAERTLYASQIQYSNILSQQLSSYVALYKALGGGW